MKISARNSFEGTISALSLGPVSTEVTIKIAPKLEMVSVITHEFGEEAQAGSRIESLRYCQLRQRHRRRRLKPVLQERSSMVVSGGPAFLSRGASLHTHLQSSAPDLSIAGGTPPRDSTLAALRFRPHGQERPVIDIAKKLT